MGYKYGCMVEEINEYLRLRFNFQEDKVIISNIMNNDGSIAIKDDNKIILSVYNIHEEKYLLNNNKGHANAPVNLNIFIMFSTTYTGQVAEEALKYISFIIAFFQGKSTVNTGFANLSFELLNLQITEVSNIWSAMGGKLSPFVAYKVKMVTIDEGIASQIISLIKEK